MKFKFLSGLSLICTLWPALAETSIKPQSAYLLPHAEKSVLTDLVRVSADMLVAAGERGHILLSSDGKSWQQSPTPLQSSLNSVYFVNPNHGWAVGHDASIIASNDGGKSWQLQQFLPELDKPLFDVFFTDEQHGFAVGAYGLFYRTKDGGKSWQQEFHAELANADDKAMLAELKDSDPEGYQAELSSVLPHINRVFANKDRLVMVGEAGFWAVSTDGGTSWQRQPEFYNGSLFSVSQSAQNTLFAVGLRGNAFRSSDNGQSWQQIALSSPATLNSVVAADGLVWLFGNSGVIFKSQDDGQSFQLIPQTEGKAVLNGITVGKDLVLATEVGIKTVQQVVSQ